jgi:uncharacterized protein (DUF1697 family)
LPAPGFQRHPLSEMDKIINKKPRKYGEEDGKYKYDIVFLIEPLTAKEAINEIQAREGVDEIYEGNKVLYFRIGQIKSKEKITKTYLAKVGNYSIECGRQRKSAE